MSLVSGDWLGRYDQLVLAKGPGYPAFLALSAVSGLSVAATHALFHIAAIAVAAWAVFRLTASLALTAIVFLLLVLHPVGIHPELQRIVRDQIYWAQSLAVFSLFAILFLAPPRGRRRALLLAVLAGAILGWAWLTREEGVWFLPGLGVVFVGALLRVVKQRPQLLSLLGSTAVAAAACLMVNATFAVGNRIAYGTYVGVDFKERNFVAAVAALQRIGPVTPFVPVPHAARAQAAAVSPTFAPLAAALASGGPLAGWMGLDCATRPSTCGDFAGGSFVWALRDAAAMNGFYISAENASRKFGQLYGELSSACDDGRLRCRNKFLSLIPPMSGEQWLLMPRLFASAAKMVAFLGMPDGRVDRPSSSHVARSHFLRTWEFLNFPLVTLPPVNNYVMTGWYYDAKSAAWPAFKVYSQNGDEIPGVGMKRLPSPDLASWSGNPTTNRLELTFQCPDQCTVVAQSEGRELRLPVVAESARWVAGDSARLHVDTVFYQDPPYRSGITTGFAVRGVLVEIYRWLVPALTLAGILATALAAWLSLRCRILPPLLIVVLAAWTLVGTRMITLVLIDASSFTALKIQYAAPALYLAGLAAVLSIFQAAVMLRPIKPADAA